MTDLDRVARLRVALLDTELAVWRIVEVLADKLKEHGLEDMRDSIAAKLKRGTFAATFLIGVIAALEMEGLRLEDL